MRQETGSNPHSNSKVMSIRITSSGHNFSSSTLNATDGEKLTILIETPKAMLLPTALLPESSLEDHLLSGGITCQAAQESIYMVTYSDTVTALIVMPTSLLNEIQATYGSQVTLSTPLLLEPKSRGHEVLVHLSKEKSLLCLKIFNGGDLLFAEMFEITCSVDVIYWLSRIGEGYDLRDYTIYIDGGDREIEKLLRKYYKSVKICE